MKLKSLLLGSAAAMMAVSGVATANAADAVFAAEPEPMEYVKVCDTYGNGFFYIPGTETCLKIGGDVRSQFEYRDVANVETTNWRWRARVNFDARNETDWGTLRARVRFVTDGRGAGASNATTGTYVDNGFIQIGGLTLGFDDTRPISWHGYGHPGFVFGGYYGYDAGVFLDYVFSANGFSAVVGVQDTASVAAAPAGSDPYDPYAGLKYAGSWGNVAATVLYDSSASEAAWKVSTTITAIDNVLLKAWYHADNGGTAYLGGVSSWAWGASVRYEVNNKFRVYAGYSDREFSTDLFAVGANWRPINGLSIQPEAQFGNNTTSVNLRIVRSF